MQNIEIERKFLVQGPLWKQCQKPSGIPYKQGYLSVDDKKAVRVRVAGLVGMITIKGGTTTMARDEFEYVIPVEEASELIRLYCLGSVEKVRYRIPFGGKVWEVDEFSGANEGLIVAEIELSSVDESFERPAWVSMEVTGDERYYNSSLSVKPYTGWEEKRPG